MALQPSKIPSTVPLKFLVRKPTRKWTLDAPILTEVCPQEREKEGQEYQGRVKEPVKHSLAGVEIHRDRPRSPE